MPLPIPVSITAHAPSPRFTRPDAPRIRALLAECAELERDPSADPFAPIWREAKTHGFRWSSQGDVFSLGLFGVIGHGADEQEAARSWRILARRAIAPAAKPAAMGAA